MARHPQLMGAALLVALHTLFVLGQKYGAWPGEWTGLKPEASYLLIGIVQLYYVVPATLLALKLGYAAVAMGMVKGALVTFLLNLAGCGLFALQISRIDG